MPVDDETIAAARDALRCGSGPDDGGTIALEDLARNPYPLYRRLRDDGVVWVESARRWLITRWEDVDTIERDGDSFTAMERESLQTRVMGRTMLRSDGGEHRRLRRAAQGPLKPQAVQQHWLPRFTAFAEEYVEGFAADGHADLMRDFAGPFTARCLGAVLGLEDATDDELQFWSQALMDGVANYGDDPAVWERTERALAEMDGAVDVAIARVREAPDASLISAMVHDEGGGDPLGDEEIHANVKLVIGGGLNEPRDGIGFVVWGLLTHREQLALALEDPAWWGPATEEAMRWMSPLAMFPREVARPVRLAGADLQPGARLGLIVASANRDERHWDRPDEFDITRGKTRNVAFGVGHHFCLGVWMARHQIGGAALPALFGRLPNLRLDLDDPGEIHGWVFRGHARLPVVWDVG